MKIIFISGMLPSGHYSQYITNGLNQQKKVELTVYADKDPKNLSIKNCGKIKALWSKSPVYFYQILKEIIKDRPDVVHLQHEINMFGGPFTTLLFPFLVLFIRIMRRHVVVTVHAVVYKKQIDKTFSMLFHKEDINLFYLRLFFALLYYLIGRFANSIIVHTNLTKNILTSDYSVPAEKIHVIPAAIPDKLDKKVQKNTHGKYFFYFGYMARRKGLGIALEGFKKFVDGNPETKFKFILAGGVIRGQEEAYDEIVREVKRNKLGDRVIFKGFLEENDQDKLYVNAYAIVIPAIISMGSSGPLYHAESYGKCVLASKIGHFIEDIDHLRTGMLVNNSQWDQAFAKISHNSRLVRKIERNTREKARARSPYKTAERYVKLYYLD